MKIQPSTIPAQNPRKASSVVAADTSSVRLRAEDLSPEAASLHTANRCAEWPLQQRVQRWADNSAAKAQRLAMPAVLKTPLVDKTPDLTPRFIAKSAAQQDWSSALTRELSDSRAASLGLIQHDMQLALSELTAGAEGTQVATTANNTLNPAAAANAPVLPETRQQLEQRTAQLETLNAAVRAGDKTLISSWDIDQFLQKSINEINDNYLSSYTDILSKFNAFFSDFADFKSNISKFITAGEDGKVKVDAGGILKALNTLKTNYSNYTLYPQAGKTATQDDAKKWAAEMGLPDGCVKPDGNGGYKVIMDTGPLETIIQSVKDTFGSSGSKEVDSAQYQAWLAGFDMQSDKYQNFMQVMTQKYTTANSVFDNLIKVLSSTITSMLESDKSFFNI